MGKFKKASEYKNNAGRKKDDEPSVIIQLRLKPAIYDCIKYEADRSGLPIATLIKSKLSILYASTEPAEQVEEEL